MKAIDIIRPWLDEKGYEFNYADDMDVVSFKHNDILLHFFTVESLFVISHSEKVDSITPKVRLAMQKVLEDCVYARPVPRLDIHKIRIKAVQGCPIDIMTYFNKVPDDVALAVVMYKKIMG